MTLTSCARCHASFDASSWSGLPIVERLRHSDLRYLVTEWPWSSDVCLEVRSCTCGADVMRVAQGFEGLISAQSA